MMKALLIDFDDSFTYNIAGEFLQRHIGCEVVHWTRLLIDPQMTDSYQFIIIGPGPGHPLEYKALFPLIRSWREQTQKQILGICLGHQLLWCERGVDCLVDPHPVHGQQVALTVPDWFSFFDQSLYGKRIDVQRYNSLYIPELMARKADSSALLLCEKQQVMASRFANCLSFQFHPESIGTSYRESFFNCLPLSAL
jgi:anthranilate/para-aminobenzoate synthase component II